MIVSWLCIDRKVVAFCWEGKSASSIAFIMWCGSSDDTSKGSEIIPVPDCKSTDGIERSTEAAWLVAGFYFATIGKGV